VCVFVYIRADISWASARSISTFLCRTSPARGGGESREGGKVGGRESLSSIIISKVHRRVHRAQKYSALSHHAYAISFCASEKGRRQTDRERVRERKQLEGSRGRRREGHVVVQAHDARDKLSLTDRQNMYCVI
jgi:hypothetical protein